MSERTFTQDEVTAIVKKRLASVKHGMPDEVTRELLRSILGRLDAIEAALVKREML